MALEDIARLSGDRPDPLRGIAVRHEREIIFDALGKLPDRERDAIVLRLLEGKDTAETAEILGVGPDTVRSILQRAVYRLRRMKEVRVLIQEWMEPG